MSSISYTAVQVPTATQTIECTTNPTTKAVSVTISDTARSDSAEFTNTYSKKQVTPTPATIEITKTIVFEDGLGLTDIDDIEFTINPDIGNVTTLKLDVDNYATNGWTRTGSGTSASPYVYTYKFNNVDNGTYTITETNNGVPTATQTIECTDK